MAITGLLLLVILLALLIWDLIGCLRAHVAFTEPGEAVGTSDPYHHSSTSYSRTTTTTTKTTRSSTKRSSGRDDWAYQADSGYYWSDSRQLYWDKGSNQYYDPATDRWSHAA
jgi:hypothetical protein